MFKSAVQRQPTDQTSSDVIEIYLLYSIYNDPLSHIYAKS